MTAKEPGMSLIASLTWFVGSMVPALAGINRFLLSGRSPLLMS